MYKMRDGWTDERMDDFRDEVNRRFDKVDERFDKFEARFGKLEERFEATHHLLLQAAIGIAGLVLAGYAALAALIAVLA
jgi:DNA anti-recombination protein RmuC